MAGAEQASGQDGGRRGGQIMQSPLNLGEEFGSYLEVAESFKKGHDVI